MGLPHQFHKRNTRGTDYAVGDIHGAFPALEKKLTEVGFDPEIDRLFGTGDLVDKGLHSRAVGTWLDKSWFHSVLGNHDNHIAVFGKPTNSKWIENYGKWFSRLKPDFQKQLQEKIAQLPIVMTVEVEDGFVGIVHAGTPHETWYETLANIDTAAGKAAMNHFIYSRKGFDKRELARPVRDLKALVVGHCPVPTVEQHGNVWYIDTEAYATGEFTLLNLNTLQPV